jgi:uncharacterized membrane protein
MATTATWLIVIGFVLLTTGVVLRTVVMMRSSDATGPDHRALHGRQLVGQYRRLFPGSPTPLITRWLLVGGSVTLLAGLTMQLTR